MPTSKQRPTPWGRRLAILPAALLLAACAAPPAAKPAMQLAYLRLTDGYWQAWLTDPAGVAHRQITHNPVDKTRLSWSPDRRALLCNQNDGRLLIVPLAAGESHAPPVSEQHRYPGFPLSLPGVFDAQWSPDGQRLSFSKSTTQNADNNDLWVSDLSGENRRRVTRQAGVSQTPGWHPDGKRLVYTAINAGRHEIWLLNLLSGNREQLTVGPADKADPAYGPSGQLAYTTNPQGQFDIWTVQRPGDRPRRVTTHRAYDAQPSWSPDGRRLAFYSLRGKHKRIWIKDLATGRLTPITPGNAASRYPVWLR